MGIHQVIETAGAERLIVIAESEYLRLVEAAEELEDIQLIDQAKARRARGETHYIDEAGAKATFDPDTSAYPAQQDTTDALTNTLKPVAPRSGETSPRTALFGFLAGTITIADDFHDTPQELVDLMTDGPL